MHNPSKAQRGITELEPAIILIAFVVVTSVLAFTILEVRGMGEDAPSEVGATLVSYGSVIAEDTDVDGNIDRVYFPVTTAAGGDAVDLTPGKTIVRYFDSSQLITFDTPAKYSVTPLGNADPDNVLESGESYELTLLDMEANLTHLLTKNTVFNIEVLSPSAAALHMELRTPPVLAKYNDVNL